MLPDSPNRLSSMVRAIAYALSLTLVTTVHLTLADRAAAFWG